MAQHRLFRYFLLGVLALIAGSIALAIAVPLEPQLIPAAVALISPGLKLAELLMPQVHKSLAWTFGWFLRIAILTNALFYFAICLLLSRLFARRNPK